MKVQGAFPSDCIGLFAEILHDVVWNPLSLHSVIHCLQVLIRNELDRDDC